MHDIEHHPRRLNSARRALALAALGALLATAAAPGVGETQSVRLQTAGQTEVQVRSEIRRAAETVCRAADRQGAYQGVYTVQNCLADAEASGLAQYRTGRQPQEDRSRTALADAGADVRPR